MTSSSPLLADHIFREHKLEEMLVAAGGGRPDTAAFGLVSLLGHIAGRRDENACRFHRLFRFLLALKVMKRHLESIPS